MIFRGLERNERTPVPVIVPTRAPLLMRPLEPRILLDAAGGETALATVNEAAHSTLAEVYVNADVTEPTGENAIWARAIQTLEHTPPYIPEFADIPDEQPSEIAFIASDVPDIDTLLDSLSSNVEIVVLDGGSDGMSQIADVLRYRTNLDAVHIFSHGSSGALALGGVEVNAETMTSVYEADLNTIGSSLVAEGDILIYGCDFASGEIGREAVTKFAQLTGADIAASNDPTGHASLGGDWKLERSTGAIEVNSLDAGEGWMGTLAPETLVAHEAPFSQIDHDEAIGSNRVIGQSFTYDSGSATYEVDQIDLVMRRLGGPPWQDITVAIRDTFTGTDIVRGTLNATALSGSYEWSSITLDSPAVLNSNQSYVFVAYTNHPSQTIDVGTEHDVGYPGGTVIEPDGTPKPTDDMLFRLINTNANTDPTITSDGGTLVSPIDVNENQTFVATVTATDPDLPADTLTYYIDGGFDAAQFIIDPNSGVLSFIAPPDFENPTDFLPNNVYTLTVGVSDGSGGSDTESYVVRVNDVNDAPIAAADPFTVGEDGSVSVDVLANDSDDEGDPLTITHVDAQAVTDGGFAVPVANGMVQLVAGELIFTPASNYNGPATFTYTVSDGNGGTGTATVSGTVTPANDAPMAVDNAYTTNEDTGVTGNAITDDTGLGVDSDIEGDALTLDVTSVGTFATAQGGSINLIANGSFTYTPPFGFNGTDSFSYTITDGALTDTATLTFNVTSVNDAPVATGGSVSTAEDTAYTFAVADFAFSDTEGDALQSVTLSNLALAGGTLTHSGGTPVTNGMTLSAVQIATLTYTPAANSTAPASFDYAVNDADIGVLMSSITITVSEPSSPSNPFPGPGIDPTPDTEDETETETEEEPETEPQSEPLPGLVGTTSTAPVPAAPPQIVLPKPQETTPVAFQQLEPVVELPPLPPVEPPKTVARPSISAPITNYGFEPINRDIFNDSLKQTSDDIRKHDGLLGTTSAKVTFAFGAAIGVGSVSWLIQSGILAATLLSALPAWKRFDPIAIVSGRRDEGEDDELSDIEMMKESVRDAGVRANRGQAE